MLRMPGSCVIESNKLIRKPNVSLNSSNMEFGALAKVISIADQDITQGCNTICRREKLRDFLDESRQLSDRDVDAEQKSRIRSRSMCPWMKKFRDWVGTVQLRKNNGSWRILPIRACKLPSIVLEQTFDK